MRWPGQIEIIKNSLIEDYNRGRIRANFIADAETEEMQRLQVVQRQSERNGQN
jgi:hypothetical protein